MVRFVSPAAYRCSSYCLYQRIEELRENDQGWERSPGGPPEIRKTTCLLRACDEELFTKSIRERLMLKYERFAGLDRKAKLLYEKEYPEYVTVGRACHIRPTKTLDSYHSQSDRN